MPRNASGTYSLPAGNPVVTGTIIASSWANTTLDDLRAEMSDSLSRAGKGGMLAPLALLDGAVGAPSLTFASELSSGLYRAGAGDLRLSVQGQQVVRLTTSAGLLLTSQQAAAGTTDDLQLSVTVAATGARNFLNLLSGGSSILRVAAPSGQLVLSGVVQTQTSNASLILVGNRNAADTGSDVVANSSTTRTVGLLLDVQNNGVSKFSVDFNGSLVLRDTGSINEIGINTPMLLRGNRSAADAGADVVLTGQATRTVGFLLDVQNNGASKFKIAYDGALNLISPYISQTSTDQGLQLQSKLNAGNAGSDIILQATNTRTAGLLVDVWNNLTTVFSVDYLGSAHGRNQWQTTYLTSNFTTTSSTLVGVTGLSFATVATGDYEFEIVLNLLPGGTATGFKVDASVPASAFSHGDIMWSPFTQGGFTGASVPLPSGGLIFTPGTGNITMARTCGIVTGAGAGTVQAQVASGTAGQTLTVYAGSVIRWRRMDSGGLA